MHCIPLLLPPPLSLPLPPSLTLSVSLTLLLSYSLTLAVPRSIPCLNSERWCVQHSNELVTLLQSLENGPIKLH